MIYYFQNGGVGGGRSQVLTATNQNQISHRNKTHGRTKTNKYSRDGNISQYKNYLLFIQKLRIKAKEESGIQFYFLSSYIKDLYIKKRQSRHTHR